MGQQQRASACAALFLLLSALVPSVNAGTLCITINSGKVKEADSSFHLSKASDPYVEVRFAGYLCRTHVADGDNTPTWNFDCGCAPNIGEQMEIDVRVYDRDGGLAGSDDYLGSSSFTVSRSTSVASVQNNYRAGGLHENGYIDFTVWYYPVNYCASNNGGCGTIQAATCTFLGDKASSCRCNDGYTDAGGFPCQDVNECDKDPCDEHASCTNTLGAFTCTCDPGWLGNGATCSDFDECSDSLFNNCHRNARCTNVDGSYTCTCLDGYSGDGRTCSAVDECSSSPCRNGGTCRDLVNGYACNCAPGYTGTTCGTNINDCEPNPCASGGACVDGVDDFRCNCPAGFVGKTCSQETDECESSPCRNGGTCTDKLNDFDCACAVGYTGKRCEVNIDDCASGPCANGGTCVDGVGSYTCTCADGFTGAQCQTNVDECASSPCVRGTCVDGVNQFRCDCPAGYEGPLCGEKIDYCRDAPCGNGGLCTSLETAYTCACPPGFTDSRCFTNIDECASGPCLLGSSCLDGVANFTCACADGYQGRLCDEDVNECAANDPCAVNGTLCVNTVGSFLCVAAAASSSAQASTAMIGGVVAGVLCAALLILIVVVVVARRRRSRRAVDPKQSRAHAVRPNPMYEAGADGVAMYRNPTFSGALPVDDTTLYHDLAVGEPAMASATGPGVYSVPASRPPREAQQATYSALSPPGGDRTRVSSQSGYSALARGPKVLKADQSGGQAVYQLPGAAEAEDGYLHVSASSTT